jgi:hypothetical protein
LDLPPHQVIAGGARHFLPAEMAAKKIEISPPIDRCYYSCDLEVSTVFFFNKI